MAVALSKRCNTGAGHHRDALRVSLSAPVDSVPAFDKGYGGAAPAIAGELRLAANAGKLTETVNITLVEH